MSRFRPGHHRPLGTVAVLRMVEWGQEWLPVLGDIAVQVSGPSAGDADTVRRAYRIVGFVEGRDRSHFRLHGERIEYEQAVAEPHRCWAFYNLR